MITLDAYLISFEFFLHWRVSEVSSPRQCVSRCSGKNPSFATLWQATCLHFYVCEHITEFNSEGKYCKCSNKYLTVCLLKSVQNEIS